MTTIGKIAKALGVNPRTIRFYEAIRLLPKPARTESGYRMYDPSIVQRIEFIQKAQSLGLSLRQTREILELGDRGDCPCGHVRKVLKAKLKDLDQKIKDLFYLKSRIRQAVAVRCAPEDLKPRGAALCPTISKLAKVESKMSLRAKRSNLSLKNEIASSALRASSQ